MLAKLVYFYGIRRIKSKKKFLIMADTLSVFT